MSIGDFVILEQASSNGGRGSRTYPTQTGATIIQPGEPVTRTVTGTFSQRMYGTATGAAIPVVATDYVVGIAQTASTNATGSVGTVTVFPTNSGTTWLVKANDSTLWDTQAEYNALVGKRVLISYDLTSYTVLATDGTTNGLVVAPLDVASHPGYVAVVFRAGLSDLA